MLEFDEEKQAAFEKTIMDIADEMDISPHEMMVTGFSMLETGRFAKLKSLIEEDLQHHGIN